MFLEDLLCAGRSAKAVITVLLKSKFKKFGTMGTECSRDLHIVTKSPIPWNIELEATSNHTLDIRLIFF